jgi:hypothetical protein
MYSTFKRALPFAVIAAVGVGATPVVADAISDHYKDRTVTILIQGCSTLFTLGDN